MQPSDQPHRNMSARERLLDWAVAGRYRDRAAEYLEIARATADPGVQKRYITIAAHYCALALAERRAAAQRNVEGRFAAEPCAHGHAAPAAAPARSEQSAEAQNPDVSRQDA